MSWAAVGAAGAVLLTGCVGEDEPAPSPTESAATVTPEEQALRDVTALLNQYVVLTSEALSTGAMPAEIDSIAGQDVRDSLAGDIAAFQASGYRLEGEFTMDSVELASSVEATPVLAVGCLDASGTAVVDAAGDRVPTGDVARQPVLVELDTSSDRFTILRFAFETVDEAGDPCGS